MKLFHKIRYEILQNIYCNHVEDFLNLAVINLAIEGVCTSMILAIQDYCIREPWMINFCEETRKNTASLLREHHPLFYFLLMQKLEL